MKKYIKNPNQNKAPLFFACFSMIAAGFTKYFNALDLFWPCLFSALCFGFLPVLESQRLNRPIKGFSLIFFGILMGFVIPEALGHYTNASRSEDYSNFNEIFKNLAIAFGAGTGGGILANHAEHINKFNKNVTNADVKDYPSPEQVKMINEEIVSQRKNKKQLNLILTVIITLQMLMLAIIIFK